jgi:hypothetical protein
MPHNLVSLVDDCADLYRCGREAQAATLLQQVISGLGEALQSDPGLLTSSVEQAVAALLGCQESQDWIGLADELQFVFKPEIAGFTGN